MDVNRSNKIYRDGMAWFGNEFVYRGCTSCLPFEKCVQNLMIFSRRRCERRVDEIVLICHSGCYLITLYIPARGWLEDSWYTEYSWTRTHTTCKAVVQRGRTVRSITIGCCPRRLRSARRLAVWKPLDLAQTERRPADRRISINLVWYGNVGPLRDGWPVHPSVFCLLPATIPDAPDAADFMLHRTWFISSASEPLHSTRPISLYQ